MSSRQQGLCDSVQIWNRFQVSLCPSLTISSEVLVIIRDWNEKLGLVLATFKIIPSLFVMGLRMQLTTERDSLELLMLSHSQITASQGNLSLWEAILVVKWNGLIMACDYTSCAAVQFRIPQRETDKNCLASIAKVRHVFEWIVWSYGRLLKECKLLCPDWCYACLKVIIIAFSERTVSLCHFLRVEISIAGFLIKARWTITWQRRSNKPWTNDAECSHLSRSWGFHTNITQILTLACSWMITRQ